MIDIVDALDLLVSCVRDRGENYRSPALDESTASAIWRYDVDRAVTGDIVTRALASAATPTTTGRWLIRRSVVDAYASGQNPFNLTLRRHRVACRGIDRSTWRDVGSVSRGCDAGRLEIRRNLFLPLGVASARGL
jgi:hypothetical protein